METIEIKAYSTRQVATMLQLPLSTINYYCRQGLLPCVKIGRHYRILKQDLEDFLENLKANSVIL